MPDQDKTEPATPKRRQEAREEGKVARSVELNTAFLLLVAIIFFYFSAKAITSITKEMFSYFINLSSYFNLNLSSFGLIIKATNYFIFKLVLPFFILILAAAFLINVVQVGFMITPKVLEIKFDKINPVNGLKNMFSLKSFGELVKSLLKAFVMSYILWLFIKHNIPAWLNLTKTQPNVVLVRLAKDAFLITSYILIFIVFMAILDYLFQRYTFEKSIMMTKQEVKDEYKQMEGDPKVKQKIRSMQMEIARRRMMEDVKKATVVVTNPTHYAVALQYKPNEMNAPKVVAKGINLIAEKIKKVAEENNIPIVEKPQIAKELYQKVKIGSEIPPELYQAVAEILSYIYRLKNSTNF